MSSGRCQALTRSLPATPWDPPDPGHPFVVQPQGTRLPAGNSSGCGLGGEEGEGF